MFLFFSHRFHNTSIPTHASDLVFACYKSFEMWKSHSMSHLIQLIRFSGLFVPVQISAFFSIFRQLFLLQYFAVLLL